MTIWYFDKDKEISGPHKNLTGDLDAIRGDCTDVWGLVSISGDVSGLKGCLTGLTGSCKSLVGTVGRLSGDISGIRGRLGGNLIGDVSGLRGDVTGIWGKADGLKGQVSDLLYNGLLWAEKQPLSLGMFASRYDLPMEFLDNSGSPALIAFHALENRPEHWLMVRSNEMGGFIVGPLAKIRKRFLGQEIAKVAVSSEAVWRISGDFDLLQTDKIYVFEHIAPMLSNLAG